jgi:hypothetical protein
VAEALNYSFNNFTNLSNYCLYGRIDIDNNRSERQAKSYVIMRKNSLFCFNDVGTEASAILLSFVETAKFNNLNVEKYLDYVFNQLASYTESDYSNYDKLRKLLPYSKELPNTLKNKNKI